MADNKKILVAVSGGFDPIHIGHVRMFQEAKKLGDELVVILNNDNWLRKKKGYCFMDQQERKEIIEGIRGVDRVVFTEHPENPTDMSVCAELRKIKPNIFANGGDRVADNVPEVAVCREINCEMVFKTGHGGKVQSSSWLIKKAAQSEPKNITLQVGVKILLQNAEGKYLLLRRSLEKYPDVNGRWDIVGGRIEPGKQLIDNLRREIKEETNLILVGEPQLLAAQDILKNDRHIVRLTYIGKAEGELKLDTKENDEHYWYSRDELAKVSDLDVYVREILAGKLV